MPQENDLLSLFGDLNAGDKNLICKFSKLKNFFLKKTINKNIFEIIFFHYFRLIFFRKSL